MPKKNVDNSTEAFEKAIDGLNEMRYILRLYVAGTTPQALRAISNIKGICEEHLQGRYELQVIIAAPTLIKKLPLPLRRIIGDMSNEERILVGLDLRKKT
jgi:circadian clock protein KaiB